MESKYTRRSESQWQTIFEQFSTSGQTQQAFCAEHGIAVAPFSARRARQRGVTETKTSPAFVQVNVAPEMHTEGLAIYLGDDVCIQCPSALPIETVAQLAKSLHHE